MTVLAILVLAALVVAVASAVRAVLVDGYRARPVRPRTDDTRLARRGA